MKKALIIVYLLVFVGMAGAIGNNSVIDPEDLSIKAGPSEPGEELSIVWLESLVYPKRVEEERLISLGVKLTSKVKSVVASFDFSQDKVALTSRDNMSWSEIYKVGDEVAAGLHLVRYTITADKGSIQRTLDFFVEESVAVAEEEQNIVQGEVLDSEGWPLTVTSTCAALVGASSRILHVGQNVTGISKVPWYKVIFEDGEQGWILASNVKEPVDEYYHLGYEAYRNKDYSSAIERYKKAITINPQFLKGYFWLAKSYYRLNKLEAAYYYIKEAVALDNRDINVKIFANVLAHKFYNLAHASFVSARYHEAIASYQKVLALKPSSVTSWIEMGHSYSKLDFPLEARDSWREALKVDPENKQTYALLNIDFNPDVLTRLAVRTRDASNLAKPAKGIPPLIADDSIKILKVNKTKKGTKIESALKSVVAMTRSLGTPVVEKGWEIKKKGEKLLVAYICEQGKGVLETFEWLVDVDTKHVSASNANARLLMSRW